MKTAKYTAKAVKEYQKTAKGQETTKRYLEKKARVVFILNKEEKELWELKAKNRGMTSTEMFRLCLNSLSEVPVKK